MAIFAPVRFISPFELHLMHTIIHNAPGSVTGDKCGDVEDALVEILTAPTDERIREQAQRLNTLFSENGGVTMKRFTMALDQAQVPQLKKFWNMFAVTTQQLSVLFKIIKERIQNLQQDLAPLGVSDKASLKEFLDRPYFAPPRFFKEPEAHVLPVTFADAAPTIPVIQKDIFSEKYLDSLNPDVASELRRIRDDWAVRAGNGELITQQVFLDQRGARMGNTTAIQIVPDGQDHNHHLAMTAPFLLYQEIRDSNEDYNYFKASIFLYRLCLMHPAFATVDEYTRINMIQPLLGDLNEFFENAKKTKA